MKGLRFFAILGRYDDVLTVKHSVRWVKTLYIVYISLPTTSS